MACVVFVTITSLTYRGGLGLWGISVVHFCSASFWVALTDDLSNQARTPPSKGTIRRASIHVSNSSHDDEWHRGAYQWRVCAVFVTITFLTSRGGLRLWGISGVHLFLASFWVALADDLSIQARKPPSKGTIRHASMQSSNSRHHDE